MRNDAWKASSVDGAGAGAVCGSSWPKNFTSKMRRHSPHFQAKSVSSLG
ncbi:hypothetical protein M3G47_04500 [Corynebacterium sanguinis]|nr:hypothetical protein [Corynebacterium sanguinis]MCT1443664.1 hypothetical protein [Corynebacterium sanguinis]MCT2247349.1 hypothetical protein [Corynebacterium sanguinis]